MKKLVSIVFIALLCGFAFGMGKPVQLSNPLNPDPVVNSGDAFHDIYEIIPFTFLDHLHPDKIFIAPLPNLEVLVFHYDRGLYKKGKFLENLMIFDLKSNQYNYLYKNKVVDYTPYRFLALKSGDLVFKFGFNRLDIKTKILGTFNYRNKLLKNFIEISKNVDIVGEIEINKTLFNYINEFYIYDSENNSLLPYEISFNKNDQPANRFLPFAFDGDLYLYELDEKTKKLVSKKKGPMSSAIVKYPYINIYKKHKETGLFKKIMSIKSSTSWSNRLVVSKNKLVEFSIDHPWRIIDLERKKVLTKNGKPNMRRYDLVQKDFIVLDDGNVLITSGYGGNEVKGGGVVGIYHDSMELYVVSEDRLVLFKTPNKNGGRKAVKLSNGDVLIYDDDDADLFRRKR